MSTFTLSATTSGTVDPWKRVRYSFGLVLGEAELQQDQFYLSERDDRHHRALHGHGVVSGLGVVFDTPVDGTPQIVVGSGLAVDGHGRWICVPAEQCVTLPGLAGWLGEQTDIEPNPDGSVSVWVTLCHLDCPSDLIPIPTGPCQTADESLTASRMADSFVLDLSLTEPGAVGELSAEELDELMAVLTTDGDGDADPVLRLRRRLSEWVRSRPDHPGMTTACLDADGCLALAEIRVAVTGGGALDTTVEPQINSLVRPDMISSQVVTEWLLRLTADLNDPALALDDLTDVDVDSATTGQILARSPNGWTAVDPPSGGGGGLTGPAGGDLAGTYPSPSVAGIVEFPVKADLPDDRRRSLAWNHIEKIWEPQSTVHAPAGPFGIVAAGDFPAFEEVPPDRFQPYNLRVEWLAQPLSYNLSFVGYEQSDEIRYVVKGDVVLNAADTAMRRFDRALDIDGDRVIPKPFEFMVVRFQRDNVRVQLASNAYLQGNRGTIPVRQLQEFFPDLRVSVEISAYGAIQPMLGSIPRVENL